VTGMTGQGVVVASIPAGAATDAVGNLSSVSGSTDNQVTFDNQPPAVTINQAGGGAAPRGSAPVRVTGGVSERGTGCTGSDVSFAGSTVGGTPSASVSGSGTTYTVSVTGMTGSGNILASIPAGAAADAAGNPSGPSGSTDNQVTFDNQPPAVTINQA